MKTTRTAFLQLALATGLIALGLTGGLAAQQGKDTFRPKDGQCSVKFPGKPKENTQTTNSAVGDLKVYTATFATTEGNVFLISYTDFPANSIKPEHHTALFDGVREGLKKDGKLTSEQDLTLGTEKLPGREIQIEKENGKQHIRFRVTVRGDRLFQVAVVGSGDFVKGKDATAFLDSFEVTK